MFSRAKGLAAEGLITGLVCVGHILADMGYDSEAQRRFIADDLLATAQIKRNRSRAGSPPLERALYRKRNRCKALMFH